MEMEMEMVEEVVGEIMRIHRSLPERPDMDEVEGAKVLIHNVEKEEQSSLESIERQSKGMTVPLELFNIMTEMQRTLVYFRGKEQLRDSLKLLDLHNVHALFDQFIQTASKWVKSNTSMSSGPAKSKQVMYSRDVKPSIFEDGDKLSLINLASTIQVSKKDLNLQKKLMDEVDCLPDSIGKLSGLVSLDLSENRMVAVPGSIGGLSSLTRLDLHSNRVGELPESVGDLLSLLFLDLRGNQLAALPASIGRLVRLEELDVSSNRLSVLPDSIGSLASLKKLNLETNDIEEIPHTIGECHCLKEVRVDYNRLKALPEAVGKIGRLEVLSVRYNNLKQLPTTMASLSSLRELDVSFNELESVPESLCFATTLVKMNLGNNFADLQSLPRSIGNLEMLQELDISNNQIRVLPDSFRMLTHLRLLRLHQNPLQVPPRHVADMGAQAVVQYMNELYLKRDVGAKHKKTWAQSMCFFSKPNKRKHNGMD